MRLLSAIFVLMLIGISSPGWAADTPTDTVKRLIESVKSYKKETSTQGSAVNAQARKVTEESFAVQDLAKRMLGPQWEKLNAGEKKDFTQLLTSLFQKVAYPKSAEFLGDVQIDFRNEKITGDEAIVATTVSHPKEGQVDIQYQLQQANGRWVIEDVLLDGVSLVTNVRSQMQQVIAKESYQGLMKRMRDKLAES